MWLLIVALFVAASLLQIIFYAAPLVLGFGAYRIPAPLYVPAVLAYFFVPAATATWGSVALIRRSRVRHNPRPIRLAVGVIVLLACLSSYLGVFVSFNMFGT